jgi:alpha-D-ribose 1-methylphosphonate 5-triphosphate synthase subunit PhnH
LSAAPPLQPGFVDPARQSQAVFRAVLEAMAAPGGIMRSPAAPNAPLPPAMAAVALTLLDYETPYGLAGFDDERAVAAYLGFHAGAPQSDRLSRAAFIFAADALCLPALDGLALGEPEYPDRAATIVVEAGAFGEGEAADLSGPGLRAPRRFSAAGLGADFWRMAQQNAALYPLGVDFIFCNGWELAALPRSTRIRLVGA